MKSTPLIKHALEIINEAGFIGLLYVIIGLIVIAAGSAILACIPTAIASFGFNVDKEDRKAIFWVSSIIIFILINICL